jgi:hypothetical protein
VELAEQELLLLLELLQLLVQKRQSAFQEPLLIH